MIDSHVPLIRSGAPLSRQVDGETVMFHPARGEYFALGRVGSRIWDLLETPRTPDEVCRHLEAHFDIDEATCRAEVTAFIEQLRAAQLVEPAGP